MSDDFQHDWTIHQYIYRRLEENEGTHRRVDLQDETYNPDQIRLFRYVQERLPGVIAAYSFWTELETRVSRFAGIATGIPDECCMWRIDWCLSRDEARRLVTVHEDRFSAVGRFHEYTNNFAVAEEDITWCEMKP